MWNKYFQKFLEGDRFSTGKLINLLENNEDPTLRSEILRECDAHQGQAHIIGITGVPGAGKSTLIDVLGAWFADQGKRVAVVAIDPSSPFRGGAILGDRVRFKHLRDKPDCFIRSMATRGHLGGVSRATSDVLRLLSAGKFDIIIVETVGIGQTEVEVVSMADTVVLVTVPGLGDQIQVVKAGIMEIGNIFVVNQSDRPGAEESVMRLKNELPHPCDGEWTPRVLSTVALKGEGIEELGQALLERHDFLQKSGHASALRRQRRVDNWNRLMSDTFEQLYKEFCNPGREGHEIFRRVQEGELSTFEARHLVWRALLEHMNQYSA